MLITLVEPLSWYENWGETVSGQRVYTYTDEVSLGRQARGLPPAVHRAIADPTRLFPSVRTLGALFASVCPWTSARTAYCMTSGAGESRVSMYSCNWPGQVSIP